MNFCTTKGKRLSTSQDDHPNSTGLCSESSPNSPIVRATRSTFSKKPFVVSLASRTVEVANVLDLVQYMIGCIFSWTHTQQDHYPPLPGCVWQHLVEAPDRRQSPALLSRRVWGLQKELVWYYVLALDENGRWKQYTYTVCHGDSDMTLGQRTISFSSFNVEVIVVTCGE